NAKEPGAGKVPRQSLRQAPAGLNAITLSENPRPKGTGCLDGLGCRVASSHRASGIAPGRDRSVSHVGLGMAGLGGGIAAGSQTCSLLFAVVFSDRQIEAADRGAIGGYSHTWPALFRPCRRRCRWLAR